MTPKPSIADLDQADMNRNWGLRYTDFDRSVKDLSDADIEASLEAEAFQNRVERNAT